MHATILEIVGGSRAAIRIMDRAGDLIEWALMNSADDPLDSLELHARAAIACMEASIAVAACGAAALASEIRALAAWHVGMIAAEKDLQDVFRENFNPKKKP